MLDLGPYNLEKHHHYNFSQWKLMMRVRDCKRSKSILDLDTFHKLYSPKKPKNAKNAHSGPGRRQ